MQECGDHIDKNVNHQHHAQVHVCWQRLKYHNQHRASFKSLRQRYVAIFGLSSDLVYHLKLRPLPRSLLVSNPELPWNKPSSPSELSLSAGYQPVFRIEASKTRSATICTSPTSKFNMSTPTTEPRYKLVFFVPHSSLEVCKQAIFAKGKPLPHFFCTTKASHLP